MVYTIIVNEQSYDLPKKTITVMSELDEVLRVDSNTRLSVKQKYEKLHGFMKHLVGDEAAKEMFGSENLNEIDLSELTLAVKKVVDAYDKPIEEYDADKNTSKLDNLPIDKIIALAKAADRMAVIPPQGK